MLIHQAFRFELIPDVRQQKLLGRFSGICRQVWNRALTLVIDLKGEFEQMYGDYLRQAIGLSLAGVAVIALLLATQLRAPRRLARVLLTMAVTVVLVVAGLHLLGVRLHLLHLVGLLLVVAVGSNYALFFDQVQTEGGLSPDVWLSMGTAVLTTAIGFGALALSRVPVLQALGSTVAPGVVLALIVAAALILPVHASPET